MEDVKRLISTGQKETARAQASRSALEVCGSLFDVWLERGGLMPAVAGGRNDGWRILLFTPFTDATGAVLILRRLFWGGPICILAAVATAGVL